MRNGQTSHFFPALLITCSVLLMLWLAVFYDPREAHRCPIHFHTRILRKSCENLALPAKPFADSVSHNRQMVPAIVEDLLIQHSLSYLIHKKLVI